MFRIPVTSLPLKKRQMLAESRSRPPMYISIEDYHYDNSIGATVYTIQIGIQHGPDVSVHTINSRFAEISKFNDTLAQEKADVRTNEFPKKKWFGNTKPEFVKQRSEDLENYLSGLTGIPGIIGKKNFRDFFGIPDLRAAKRISSPF
jgi:hypothetical protein